MTRRYVLLTLLLMGGVLVTDIAWAQSSAQIQELKVGCDKGTAFVCSSLGRMYYTGQGVKQDVFQAVDLFRKACDGEDAFGCISLGTMYAEGQGVKQSDTDALTYYGKACDLRDEFGCKFYAKLKQKKR